jgi:DNA-binding transcriptional LysR family regulator
MHETNQPSGEMNRRMPHATDALRYANAFLSLVDELHFGRAAVRLGIGQPSLSQQIRRLEQLMGVSLFDRGTRGVRLTPAAVELARGMRVVVAQTRRSVEDARRIAQGRRQVLRIGFIRAAVYEILPRAVAQFRVRHPDIDVVMMPSISSSQISAVRSGTVDVAFVRGPIPVEVLSPDLCAEQVAEEPLFLALPSAHKLARCRSVRLSQVADECVITFPAEQAAPLAATIALAWKGAGAVPTRLLEVDEWVTIVNLVAAGVGVSVVPASVRALGLAGVRYRAIADCHWRAVLSAVWRRNDDALDGPVRSLVAFSVGSSLRLTHRARSR